MLRADSVCIQNMEKRFVSGAVVSSHFWASSSAEEYYFSQSCFVIKTAIY